MPGLDGKKSLTYRAFCRTGRVTLETAAGETVQGRGIVTAFRQETGEPGGKPHPLGVLSRPLYRFAGFLPRTEEAAGGVLTQAGQRYRVLDVRQILLGERKVCVRALLERREKDEV